MEHGVLKFFKSSIGSKIIMAATGIGLIVFIIAHLLGNLEIYQGREAVNTYGAFLRTVPKLLWTVRIGLIVIFVLHIWTSIRLSMQNRAARAHAYTNKKSVRSTLASRTMLLSGLVVLSFLAFHLCHLTWGLTHPEHFDLVDDKGRHDVFTMTVLGFQSVYVVGFYVLAQILLGMHLSHGFSSAAQTLGLTSNGTVATLLRRGGLIFAIVVCTLYISIPISVWLGIVQVEF
jgi:succinate dehydrogenase / fumarate reductase cytochrome b subunit